jgi:hypothetical protein
MPHSVSTTLNPPVKPVTGKHLACQVRTLWPQAAAELALGLMDGSILVQHFTLKQACALTGASPRKVNEARHANAGVSLPELEQSRAIDRLIEALVKAGGVDRLMARLDEMTTPKIAAVLDDDEIVDAADPEIAA